MEIHHLKNCAFIGENTTLMLEGIIQYWDIVFCENILMQGFNLKFRIPPYTVSEVLEADYETMTVLVRTRDSLGTRTFLLATAPPLGCDGGLCADAHAFPGHPSGGSG